MKSKYVIIEHDGMDAVIVFTPNLLHPEVAINSKIKSAGFCKLDAAGHWITFGGSVSLKCDAKPQDAKILNELLGTANCL
jgi:hypothetical protein